MKLQPQKLLPAIKNSFMAENRKQRVLLIVLFAVFILAFVFIFMPRTAFTHVPPIADDTAKSEAITKNNPFSCDVPVTGGTLKGVGLVFSDNGRRNTAEYTLDFVSPSGEVLMSNVFNADKVTDGEAYYVPLPNIPAADGEVYTIQVYTKEAKPDNALSVYSPAGTPAFSLGYERFSQDAVFIAAVLIVLVAAAMLFWTDKLHTNMLVLLLIFGVLFSLITPVFDVPDEPEHFSKTYMMASGHFFRMDAAGGPVANNASLLHEHLGSTLADSPLHGVPVGSAETYTLLGSGQFFLGYLPQALGVFFAKLFGLDLLPMFYMGRIFNAVCYALLAWFAIKKAVRYKWFLAVVSLMPMSIFIASSYNPDGLIYGLCLVLISFFINLLFAEDGKVGYKKMLLFAILCAVIAMKKYNLLPLCLLPFFIPAKRFARPRVKWLSAFMTLGITLAATLGVFFLISAMDMAYGSHEGSALSPGGVNLMGANMYEQLGFMLQNPTAAASIFSKAIMQNLGNNLSEMFTFGWMDYSIFPIFIFVYYAFLAVVAFAYTKYEYQPERQLQTVVSLASRLGIFIIMALIIVCTYAMLYLSWTPVGLDTILGVQGRYFVPVLMLLPFIGQNGSPLVTEGAYRQSYYNIQFVAMLFAAITLITTVLQYY
ncbi:MAG: DUF2142 domain-containing protein [Christensenellaceae bacterium]|jgi:uncharacterized membrane protein